jgi:tetratricopeptide (TPR) repeat protein
VAWARRAAAIAPDDETVLRRLLVALDRAGDRAGALAAQDDFRRRLESEFGASPAPETEAVIHRLRTRQTPWPTGEHGHLPHPSSAPAPVQVNVSRRAEALTAMGISSTHYFWRWAEAEERFQSAQAADPGYWPALHWYSHLLMAQGRVEESLGASRRAIELAPQDPIAAVHLAWHFWLARDAESAIQQSERAALLSPDSAWPAFMSALAFALDRRYARAIPALRTAVVRSAENPVMLAALGVAHAEAGDGHAARATLRQVQLRSARHRLDYHVALIHAALGETAEALHHLERALIARLGWIAYLDVDPRLDRLRGDPRFTRLVEARNSSGLATLTAD